MSRNGNLDAVINSINKKFGANTVNYMSNIKEDLEIKRYSSPSYEFDIMLGGGIAVGKIIELYGQESSGKTSMAIEIIKHNQKLAKKEGRTFTVGWFETGATRYYA